MTDDFTNLETGASCYVLSNTTTIYSYKNNTRTTYIQVGGKWFLSAQTTYYSVPDNAVCWSYSDITKLNTNAQFYPEFMFIALAIAVFVWYIVFKLISRLVKWKA